MKFKFWRRSPLSRPGKEEQANGPRLLARLLRDEEGSYLLIVTLAIPVFIGAPGPCLGLRGNSSSSVR